MIWIFGYVLIGLSVLYYDFSLLKRLGMWEIELGSLMDKLKKEYGKEIPLSDESVESIIIFSLSVMYILIWPIVLAQRSFK